MDVNLEFVHSEALAEKFVEHVTEIKLLLKRGNKEKCLAALSDMQEKMVIALAISESCCSDELH